MPTLRRNAVRLALSLASFVAPHAVNGAGIPYDEPFQGADGAAWPSPWFPGSSHVTVWDQQGGRARLDGDPGFVARMILPGFSETDVEVQVTFEFEDAAHQGIGFYVRQNGGTLREYLPHGQGYAMFLKGPWAWPEDLGLWREIDGVETEFAMGSGYNPVPGGILDGTRYRLRYRVTQETAGTTRLQARVWPEAGAEPAGWTIDATDTRAELQGTAGSFAVDIYNHSGVQHIFIDDLTIQRFPYPVEVARPSAPSRLALGAVRPNPVVAEARFDLSLPVAADVEVVMFDLAGRVAARPFAGSLAAGTHALRFHPEGARLTPGVYLLVATTSRERACRRIVVRP